jgi:glycosyltransferase involved in cell wall biosynthesis
MNGEKLKIAYIGRYNESEILTGPEKMAKRIFEENKNFHEPVFIQYFFDGQKYSLLKKLFGYEIKENVITAGIVKFFLLLFSIKPNIIHIITFERFAYIAILYSALKKVKVVYNSHGIITYEDSVIKHEKGFYKFKNRFVEKRLFKKSDVIIFHSEKAKALGERYYNINSKKCIIIPNGIDFVFHDADARTERRGCVFIAGEKLHESSRLFLNRFLDFSSVPIYVHIIGSKKFCINFTKSNVSISDKVDAGSLAEFYKDKQVYLSLNNYDTFSISAAEAMAAGLIPIVTADTGICSYIKNGENGFIVNYGDISQLENILTNLSKMNDEAKTAISLNAKSIYNDLNWHKVYNMYDNIYHLISK